MKKIAIIVLTIFVLTSCTKKTECSGTVYSRYNVPVPGIEVRLLDYLNSSSPSSSSVKTTTDANGHYSFKFRMEKKHQYAINCKSDTGSVNAVYLKYSRTNKIDLKFD
jgi:hypothetical protein